MRVPEEIVGKVPAMEEAVVRAAAGKDELLQDIREFEFFFSTLLFKGRF